MSQINFDPYLFFKGDAKEALEFYKSIFGGDVEISLYDSMPPEMSGGEAMKGKVMHGLLSGGLARIMVSDTNNASDKAAKIELSLSGEDEAVLRGCWDKLAEGGTVRMPLEKAPWGDTFGMLTDKYNFDWMVNIVALKS